LNAGADHGNVGFAFLSSPLAHDWIVSEPVPAAPALIFLASLALRLLLLSPHSIKSGAPIILTEVEELTMKTVRDIIKGRKEVYSISNQATVAEAARYLKDRSIRASGVCNLSGKVVGVVSQSDISDKVVAENYRPSDIRVQAIASTNLIKIEPESDYAAAMQLMADRGVYHLVVEDSEGVFLGLISIRDCIAISVEEEKERADIYKSYAFPTY
jgi:CBS domain-containing protein